MQFFSLLLLTTVHYFLISIFILNHLSIFDTFHFTMKSSSAKKSLVSVLFLIKIISQRGRVDYSLLLSLSLTHTLVFAVVFHTIDCSSSSTFFFFSFCFWCSRLQVFAIRISVCAHLNMLFFPLFILSFFQ